MTDIDDAIKHKKVYEKKTAVALECEKYTDGVLVTTIKVTAEFPFPLGLFCNDNP